MSADHTLATGEQLSYHRPGWREPAAPRDFTLLHEDEDVVAVDKPSGLQVLPAAQFLENTLLHVVRERLGHDLAPLHRLGRGTSGIVLFARSEAARRSLSAAFSEGGLRKTYRALTQGLDLPPAFTVRAPIGPVAHPAIRFVHAASRHGRPSVSHVRVLERRRDDGASLVDVEIPTGRPHQIRIHLAAAGYPLVGEPLYARGGRPMAQGEDETPALPGDLGYWLHARSVELSHPATGQMLRIDCEPPPPLCGGD